MHFPGGRATKIPLAATVMLAIACGERGPSVPSDPLLTPRPTASLTVTPTTTVWDFVALSGAAADMAVGNPITFSVAGAGSIVASSPVVDPPTQIFAHGVGDPAGTEERGLGLCRGFGVNGICVGGEIGDTYPDGITPSLFLDLTGLASGSIVQSVTLSSLQVSEGWAVYSSTDGSTYALVSTGTSAGGAQEPTFTIPVPSGTKFLRFDPGPGASTNDYLVQSVTTVGGTTTNGKTFSIGPSSMEGAILIANGDWVNGGYSFSFASGSHIATNFSVHATVTITGACIGGGPATDTFTFPLNDATYSVPAGNTSWLPTGDQNSVLSWQGSVIASGVCGGIGKLDARHGAVFTATVSQSPASGSLVNFRFKYRDPAAKGKPNTNCLDTSDPNRAKADVCGASWSQTVKDP